MKDSILIRWHLGCGDAIICNAIVRQMAKQFDLVCLPVKYRNCASVEFMFRDLKNVVIRPCEDDGDANQFAYNVWKGKRLGLGAFGPFFNWDHWDESFYAQANMPFGDRWTGWICERDHKTEIKSDLSGMAFVHDDPTRFLNINVDYVRSLCAVKPYVTTHIFQWWNALETASELHCISSCFALFADSIPDVPNQKLYLHAYARPGEQLPKFRKDWTIIR